MSIYALKGRFQNLLRPMVRNLHRQGVTANQVTHLAGVLSLLVAGWVFWQGASQPLWYGLLPLWMLLRMAFNAVDGMLAREFGQASRLGAYLNELWDVVADAALYLSLLGMVGVSGWAVWSLVLLAALGEYAGVLGVMVGASRRYDGPMGKSDRAAVIGLVGLALAVGLVSAQLVNVLVWGMAGLCLVTVFNRVRKGLQESAQ